ncbi:hypothetical protein BG011_008878 [Mortierella polycephala]|uniref:SET domain-containing protein n=1 Tax=Mortierella polycephala TaxID=41804 RepID=A0A9P6PQ95_9FUNG|nr:hypothetical protein BG011_008878 [Mortierella polycephala]
MCQSSIDFIPGMDSIPLLDQSCLQIQDCGAKGRGVITRTLIPTRTIIDISPIILFPTEEYSLHGQHTQLDHYTYRWQGGMALALGLGSMFNHSNDPNVGFQRDFDNKLIRYTALREIYPGEELCISYGTNLWFPDMEGESQKADRPDSGYEREHRSIDLEPNLSDDETGELFLARMQLSRYDDDDDYPEEDC